MTEEKLWADFEEARPRILGALLDILSDALRLLPAIELEGAPRLADFARLGTAVERSLGWPPGSFLRTLDASQSDAVYDALDAEAITDPLIGFAKKMGKWEGTMTKLLDSLDHAVGEEVRRRRSWPPNASQLGIRIRRIAPGLRDVGVHVEDAPAGRDKDKHRGIRVWVDPPGTAGTAGTPDGGP